jgi:D-methionine transport system substrate-binding protein
MKKVLGFLTVLVVGLVLVACGNDDNGDYPAGVRVQDGVTIVTVAVVGARQDQWEAVNAELASENIRVELVTFDQWTVPNPALNDGEVALNAFQNHIFLENAINTNGYDLAVVGDTFIVPQNVFNGRANIPADYTRTSLLGYVQDGWTVGIPQDLTNGGRALKVLEAAGLITLNPDLGWLVTPADIIEFHVDITIHQAEANTLPTLLPDLDIAVINNPQALNHGLSANAESIFREDALNIDIAGGLINIIVARAGEEDNEIFQRIIAAYQTQAVRDVFRDNFDGAFIPAW